MTARSFGFGVCIALIVLVSGFLVAAVVLNSYARGPSSQTTAPDSPARKPLPDASEQKKAETLIKELFKDDYAKQKPAQLAALAGKLLQQTHDPKEDQATRFVLFREARDLAAEAGDHTTALSAVNRMAAEFDIRDGIAMRVTALETAARQPGTQATNKSLTEAALGVSTEAIGADDYTASGRALKIAEAAATRARIAALLATVQARLKEAADLEREFEKTRAAQKTLETSPNDADASLTVGRYVCFVKGNWEKGLPLLSRGRDARLKELALKDLGEPAEAAEQVEIGDGWYEIAKTLAGRTQEQVEARAVYWYRVARPKLSGLVRTKVDKLLRDSKVPEEKPKQYLVDLAEFDVKMGPWAFGKGELNGAAITVKDGVKSPKGLGMAPPNNGFASVKYRVTKEQGIFKAQVGINDNTGGPLTPITFAVYGDGRLLWKSNPVRLIRETQDCSVSIRGVDVLELRVTCPGKYEGAHAVWLEPHIVKDSPK